MLYDVVSPAIFFLSLGGIILIAGRIAIRVRRQQFTESIQSQASEVIPTNATWSPGSIKEVSSLLQPSKKSVRVITSRLGLVRQHMQHNTHGLRAWWQERRERKTGETEALVSSPAPDAAAPASRFIPPVRRFSSLMTSARTFPGRVRQAVAARRMTAPASEQETPAVPAVPLRPSFTLKRNEAVSADSTSISETAPAIASTAAARRTRPVRRNLLLRNPHPVEESTPKTKAHAALAAGQYQKVEDVMVSYIVKHPKDTEAYMLLGQAAIGRGAWTEAMEIFEQVLSWNQEEKGAYAGLGTAAYHAGKFTRALQALQRAHDADPRDRAVLECLLAIAQKLDNRGLLHSLEQAIKELPERQEPERTPTR